MTRSPRHWGPESVDELLAAAVPFSLPLRMEFRGLTSREGVLVKGPSGWGEFAPFDDYDEVRSGRWLEACLEASWGTWPEPRRDAVDVNAIIPAVDSARAGVLAREAIWERQCRTMKVKVGSSLAEDEARVVAVRDAMDSADISGCIRLDANGAWDVEQASIALRRLGRYGIEYVEQPCAELDDIARLRSDVEVPIAVDENLRAADDPESLSLKGIADFAICKPMTLGGAWATLRIAETVGVPVIISGSLDTGVGLSTSLATAAALPELHGASGLGTGSILAADLTDPPRIPEAGRVTVGRSAPDLDALMRATDAIDDDRAAWWRQRLADAYRALVGDGVEG